MSMAPCCGRASPRWSVVGALTLLPAPMAGLPDSKAIVGVGPPLFASAPNLGLIGLAVVPTRSLLTKPELRLLALPIRLWPRLVKVPLTSVGLLGEPVLPATMVL